MIALTHRHRKPSAQDGVAQANSHLRRGASMQHGFSLIEALIAFAVLSFGVMGVVTLLAGSKAAQFETVQRTRAVTLANSLVERIRINPAAVATYHTGLDDPIIVDTDKVADAEPVPACNTGVTCDIEELAIHDMWEWREEFRGATAQIRATGEAIGGLLEPQACVIFVADAGRAATGTLTILVTWRGLVEGSDAALAGEVCGDVDEDLEVFRRQVAVRTVIVDETEL